MPFTWFKFNLASIAQNAISPIWLKGIQIHKSNWFKDLELLRIVGLMLIGGYAFSGL